MFKKILIANRGEIACRIIKTARRMGIACVAVYSKADRRAPFVAMADEAIPLGSGAGAHPYLAIDEIIAACCACGAEAVHPGYGFLSESANFAAALSEAGIVFVGPNRHAIATMGDKIAAKMMAEAAGVPITPGFLRPLSDPAEAAELAAAMGYPVVLKAVAGGGGKGMRVIDDRSKIAAGFASARSEAQRAFGDDRVFIEKFIAHPRHIEIQILGDKYGNLIHLGERECSIQRRHQKIIEEAPAPLIGDALRAGMATQALALAKAVDYDSAGTVEFLVDPAADHFYFLEMNTRLQVEHPVTELVAGVDLVEAMIRIAAGDRLPLRQADVHLRGWAIEARIYAEDPARDFLPSSGRLAGFRPPKEGHRDGVTLRVDTGVVEGSEVTIHYDPLIGKLVTHAGDRARAIAALADALDQFVIEGVSHNVPLLATLIRNSRFRHGAPATDLIAEEFPQGFAAPMPSKGERDRLAAVAASIDHVMRTRRTMISGRIARPVPVATPSERTVVLLGSRIDVIVEEGDEGLLIRVEESADSYICRSDWGAGAKLWVGTINDEPIYVQVRPKLNCFELVWRGIVAEACILSRRHAALAALMPAKAETTTPQVLRSPMPGLLKSILVRAGQTVTKGEGLCIMEAMKMETVLRAERNAVVRGILASEGALLAIDAPIMEFS